METPKFLERTLYRDKTSVPCHSKEYKLLFLLVSEWEGKDLLFFDDLVVLILWIKNFQKVFGIYLKF
jgi:hypothetical protein